MQAFCICKAENIFGYIQGGSLVLIAFRRKILGDNFFFPFYCSKLKDILREKDQIVEYLLKNLSFSESSHFPIVPHKKNVTVAFLGKNSF